MNHLQSILSKNKKTNIYPCKSQLRYLYKSRVIINLEYVCNYPLKSKNKTGFTVEKCPREMQTECQIVQTLIRLLLLGLHCLLRPICLKTLKIDGIIPCSSICMISRRCLEDRESSRGTELNDSVSYWTGETSES